jgi:DNA repair exonuclease SbcCD ATPase subunit
MRQPGACEQEVSGPQNSNQKTDLSVAELLAAAVRVQELETRLHEREEQSAVAGRRHREELAKSETALRREQAAREKAVSQALVDSDRLTRQRDEATAQLEKARNEVERAKSDRQQVAEIHHEQLTRLREQLTLARDQASTPPDREQIRSEAAAQASTREKRIVSERDAALTELEAALREADREKTERQQSTNSNRREVANLSTQLREEKARIRTILKQLEETNATAVADRAALEDRLMAKIEKHRTVILETEGQVNAERAEVERLRSGHRAEFTKGAAEKARLTAEIGQLKVHIYLAEQALFGCALNLISHSAKEPMAAIKTSYDLQLREIEDLLAVSPNGPSDWQKTIASMRREADPGVALRAKQETTL